MPTQQEIAEHLGITQQAVSAQMTPLGIDWRTATMDAVRLAYLTHLRGVAAGHRSTDGLDLARERALTERVDRELKELTLAEKRGRLVDVAQLEPALARQYVAFRVELEGRDDKLREELQLLYGIEIDADVIAAHTRHALEHLSGHVGGGAGDAGQAARGAAADAGDDDDAVGDRAAHAVAESHGEARPLQP